MSRENVEVVRSILAAWRRGRPPMDSDLLDPDIEWVNPPYAVESGVRHGLEGFSGAAAAAGDVSFEPERFVDAGEHVVVIGAAVMHGQASGLEVRRPLSLVWTLRDGRAVRFRWFNEEDEALRAAGLEA